LNDASDQLEIVIDKIVLNPGISLGQALWEVQDKPDRVAHIERVLDPRCINWQIKFERPVAAIVFVFASGASGCECQ
jgi:hypothetical protein